MRETIPRWKVEKVNETSGMTRGATGRRWRRMKRVVTTWDRKLLQTSSLEARTANASIRRKRRSN